MTAEEALKLYYEERRISQLDLALELDVSQGTVHNWLSGKRKIPMEHYIAIAKLCNVPLDQILPGTWKQMLKGKPG